MPIAFNGSTKTIALDSGSLNVRDCYSRWKDWVANSNAWALPAFAPVGGDPIDPGAGTTIPLYAFLVNGWRIRPQEANHTLNVTGGVLLVDGGGDPFLNTIGNYVVRINYQQPVQAITVSTVGGGASAAEIWAHAIEGLSAEQIMRIALAALAGRTVGIGTDTETYKGQSGEDRIVTTFDPQGNRQSVTLIGG